MARGVLRVHLGAAPGVGKTVAMLEEGNRRAGRGTDVVVALVEFHGRRLTRDAVGQLEELPRQSITYRGAQFTEGSDQRVLAAFASQAAAALPTQRLVRAVQEAEPLRAADRTRTALLQAVSHDLRTPLASAKAAISSLRGGGQDAVDWSPQDTTELLATVDESLDRLTRLVNNLLDMSRLQAGAMPMAARPVDVSGVVARALDGLGAAADAVTVSVPLDLPEVTADAGLIERVVANLVENALRFSGPDSPPMISASAYGDRVEIRIVDRGRGLDAEAKDRMFVPFQRLADNSNRTGVELGLALARGLTEAMGGELTPEDTPGGGLTMVISLPAVTEAEHPAPAGVFP